MNAKKVKVLRRQFRAAGTPIHGDPYVQTGGHFSQVLSSRGRRAYQKAKQV